MSERTRIKGSLLEDEQGLSVPIFQMLWDHVPTPPFKVQRIWPRDAHPSLHRWMVTWSWDDAMDRFVDWMDLRAGSVLVLDETFGVMVGVSRGFGVYLDPEDVSGGEGWFGVQAGFRWLYDYEVMTEAEMFAAEMKAQMVLTP